MRTQLFVLTALALLACSSDPDSPDAAVRATLAAIEAAAEARDVGAVKVHISEFYSDAQGNDKRAVVGVAALHLMRNQAVYTLSRIQTIDTSEAESARVTALVALAGRPIRQVEALATTHADLYRFDVRLREEELGVWRVVAAAWQPAVLADFR